MNKGIKLRGLLTVLCSVFFFAAGFESRAEEMSGEQTVSQEELQNGVTEHSEEITMMDEDGNIVVIGDTDGVIESSGIALFSRSTPVKVVNFNTKNGSVTEYKEYGTGAAGYTNGDYGADAAYLGTENGKVKFMLSGIVGLVSASEVQVVNLTDVKAVSYYIVQNGRLWHRIVHNMNQSGYISALDQGPAPTYLTSGREYYSYDGHYFYADYAQMLNDYVSGTRKNSVNASKPHYNYYQYLPLRSTTNYSAADITSLVNAKLSSGSKMKNTGSVFVNHQNTYGVNALLMTGVAANESMWGLSTISKEKNNLFGLNAIDTSPGTSANTYASVSECIKQFAESYMSKRYLSPGYSYYHGAFLGNKASGINVSYASDPYWGEKAANAAWTLDKNGKSKDYGKYTIGIKDTVATEHNSVNVRSGSSTASAVLYKTGTWTSYAVLLQKDTAENGFYKIQSDGVLNSGRTKIDASTGKYNSSQMYAYISDDYVTIVNKGNNVVTQEPEETKTYTKYVTTTSVNYRTGPGTSYSKGGSLVSGATIEVEDGYSKSANGYTWYRFKKDSTDYYVASQYVKKVSSTTTTTPTTPAKTYTKYTTTTSVNYRTGPGTSYSKGGTLASGATIEVEDGYSKSANGYTWYRFKKGSTDYYVASQYVKKVSSTTTTPTTPAKTYTKYTTTTSVNYRTGPGTSYSKGGTLASGATIEVEDGYSKSANGYTWYRFKKGSTNYYVASQYVKKVSSTTTKTYTKYTTTTSVNYRTGPGTSYSKGGTLGSGVTIDVENGYSKSANGYTWYRFKSGSTNYYIASKYLKKK